MKKTTALRRLLKKKFDRMQRPASGNQAKTTT